jgi:hypothetical protein
VSHIVKCYSNLLCWDSKRGKMKWKKKCYDLCHLYPERATSYWNLRHGTVGKCLTAKYFCRIPLVVFIYLFIYKTRRLKGNEFWT